MDVRVLGFGSEMDRPAFGSSHKAVGGDGDITQRLKSLPRFLVDIAKIVLERYAVFEFLAQAAQKIVILIS